MTDAELVRLAREHDSEAWKTLCGRYLPVVWRYAYAHMQDVHLAEDLASEVMLAFLKNIHQIDPNAPCIAGWLRTVVRNKAADHLRQSYRIKGQLQLLSLNGTLRPESTAPATALESEETRVRVLEVLEQLPPKHRLLLEWKYLEGLRVREIALRLDESEKGIEALLYRARRVFRRCFDLAEHNSGSASTDSLCEEKLPPK